VALYDLFVSQQHPPVIRRLMCALNSHIVRFLKASVGPRTTGEKLTVLEVGPGKGYFYSACVSDGEIEYFALDRNEKILQGLDGLVDSHKFYGEVPNLPEISVKLDVIYAAFVLEHLPKGGESQFEFVQWAKQHLKPGGIIAFQVPDAEKLGMEFWNIDYTHTFPTTKRSVAHALYDNLIYDVQVHEVNGLLTHRFFTNRWLTLLIRVLLVPYQYKVLQWLAYFLFGRPSWNQGNIFFSVYGLLKEPNLFIVGRVPEKS
jgi:SAM-dependent methyltransferase